MVHVVCWNLSLLVVANLEQDCICMVSFVLLEVFCVADTVVEIAFPLQEVNR